MHLVAVVFLSLLNAAEQSRQRIGLQGGATSRKGADASSNLDQFMLPEGKYEGGKCLDGTQAGFYYGPPSSGNSTLWVIYLRGGGGCETENSCNSWAKGDVDPEITPGGKRGGSAGWSKTMTGGDQLSSDATENPDFHDAHHVYVPYCTGDAHLGQVSKPTWPGKQPPSWPGLGYYFDGHLNFKAILQELSAEIPAATSMQRVLFQGSSAGGIGCFTQCDFLHDWFDGLVDVKCNPKSCWSPGNTQDGADPDSPPTSWENWKVGEVDPPRTRPPVHDAYRHQGCVEALGQDKDKCDTTHNMYQYVKAPMYVIHDMFDYAVLANVGLPKKLHFALETREYVAYVGHCTRVSMTQIKDHPQGKQGDGYFLPACYAHGSDGVIATPIGDFGKADGLGDWFFGRTSEGSAPRVLVDECASMPPYLPCTRGCPHLPSLCKATLQSICGVSESPTGACLKCANSSQQDLGKAKCTCKEVEKLCGFVPTPTQPTSCV